MQKERRELIEGRVTRVEELQRVLVLDRAQADLLDSTEVFQRFMACKLKAMRPASSSSTFSALVLSFDEFCGSAVVDLREGLLILEQNELGKGLMHLVSPVSRYCSHA